MSFLFSSSVYSKRRFPDQDLALRGVWRVKKISFYLQQVFFSFRPQSIQRDVFLTKIWLSGVFEGSRKYLFTFSKSFLFSSTVYSRRCFLWPRNGKSTTVNNYQWSRHRLQTERTRLKQSFEWPIPHHGGKYLSKKYQYPGSETVWYKNVWQMDFYSPLIPSGGLNAEPMVNAAYEELFEARLGIATSNSMCLSLGKESCKSGRFFWWG